MPFIYDLIDPQELLGFVRGLNFPQFTLQEILPVEPVDDIEYRFLRNNLVDVDSATFRAFDAESPIAKRQGVTRVSGELPPISRKIRLGEEERLRRDALRGGSGQQRLIDQIYADARNMARSVHARLERARGEALYDGSIAINENGVQGTVDFSRAATHEVVAGTVWSNAAALIVSDLSTWRDTYVATNNGLQPGSILTSTKVVGNMLRNDQVRDLATDRTSGPVARTGLDALLEAHGLPPVRVYDTQIRIGGVATRVIPDDRVIFLPPADEPLGGTLVGTTAEAMELAEASQVTEEQLPGLVAVIDKTTDPVAVWTKAVAIGLPVMANPDLTFVADVL